MAITGTTGNDILDGTIGADEIFGLAGNDTVNALEGDDTIYGGLGNDTLNGGDGNDTFIEDEFTVPSDVFNGGAGTDTIELRVLAAPVATSIGAISAHLMVTATSLNSIERLVFASQPGSVVQGVLLYTAVPASGLVEVVGGSGTDLLTISTGVDAGSFTIPELTYTGFASASADAWDAVSDSIVLSSAAASGTIVTLNASNAIGVRQILVSGNSDDTLNGSANGDILNGGDGTNSLFGNGGNDSLAIANFYSPNGAGGFNPPTVFNGFGSTLDGGSGTDVLTIGGYVELRATLVSIEGVNLQPAFTPPVANTAKQDTAFLSLDSDHIAMLPSNAFFTGTGTVEFVPDDGTSLNLSSYVLTPGHAVTFTVIAGAGSGLTFTGNTGDDTIQLWIGDQTAIGGDGNDWILFGAGNQLATGGAGADRFSPGQTNGIVTDFTPGVDKVDLSDSEIFNLSRLSDLMSESAGSAVISATTTEGFYQMTLQGVALASLDQDDFILGSDDSGSDFDIGTAAAEYFFGGSGNDEYHGGGGNDRLYAGGGVNLQYGDDGDDVIILDSEVLFGGTYDGGSGTDTLLLRNYYDNNPIGLFGPTSNYLLFGASQASITGIERMQFDSDAGTAVSGVILASLLGGSGLTELIGGDGTDSLVAVVTAGGSYTLANYTLTNWTGEDALILYTNPPLTADVTLTASTLAVKHVLIAAGGNDTLTGAGGFDTLDGAGGSDTLTGGAGNDSLIGGSNIDTAVVSGNRAGYTVTQTTTGNFTIVGPDGTDTLTGVEFLQFADQLLRLLPGTGTAVDFNSDPDTYMAAIRDFDGNNLGAGDGWLHIGAADIDGDGDTDQILVNRTIGRFAEVAAAPDGLVYFADHGWAGETRVVGIYIDPLVASGQVVAGGPFDSQTRFQNDLFIENINGVLGGADYDHDGLQEVYFKLTDGTAYLHAYMHADGNIRYANYQSQQQVIDFLTAEGWAPSTWASWFPSNAEPPASAPKAAPVMEAFSSALETADAMAFSDHGLERWQTEFNQAVIA